MKELRTFLLLVIATCYINLNAQLNLDSLQGDDVQSIMDSIMLSNMDEYQIPGVTYTVVKNDKILALNAHGLANISSGEKMTVRHKFMLGSLSKIVTATAVMQLEEKGILDLDKDVNEYLKTFKTPKPVTLRQLLTHTAGFEEKGFDRMKLKSEDMLTLEEYLKKNLPNIIFEPGKKPAYSNHGLALAGYILQEVSEQPFEQYMVEHIFTPLEMKGSSFVIDEHQISDFATPYLLKNNELKQTHLEYVQTIPASMLIGDAEDMAHFMIAHSSDGQFKGNYILSPKTVRLMHSRQYTPHPELKGRAIAFFEYWHGNMRGLSHGNNRNGYVSYMVLLPEVGLGIFVTFNGGQNSFRNKVIDDFLSVLYPNVTSEKVGEVSTINEIEKYKGSYIPSRRNESTIESFFHYMMTKRFVEVRTIGDTSLSIFGRQFILDGENLFISKEDAIHLYFGEEGQIKTLFLGGRSDSYDKLSWHAQAIFPIIIFTISFLLFLIFVIKSAWIFMFRKKVSINNISKSHFWFSLTGLLFLLSFSISMGILQEGIQYGIPGFFYIIFLLPIISLLLFPVLVYSSMISWHNLSIGKKIYVSFFLIISCMFIWQLYYWNFIGYNF